MLLKGVKDSGKDVEVNEDFSIHVPYGCCYENDLSELDDDIVLIIARPKYLSDDYGDKYCTFSDDGTQYDGIIKLVLSQPLFISEDSKELGIDFLEKLHTLSEQAQDNTIKLGFTFDGETYGDDPDVDKFNRMYKLVKDSALLQAGYFTSGLFGRTTYNILIATKQNLYACVQCMFADEDYDSNEEFLDELLDSIKYIDDDVEGKTKDNKRSAEPFFLPEYKSKNFVQIDSYNVTVPDEFEYISKDYDSLQNKVSKSLLSDYSFVAIPKNFNGGLNSFKDAPIGINISYAQEMSFHPDVWDHPEDIKEVYRNNAQGYNVKFVKEDYKLLVGYGKGNECLDEEENYWVIYFIVIICGSKQYTCNIYFNTQKSTELNYIQVVEDFCANINIDTKVAKTAHREKLKETLEPLLADNGKLNAVLVAQLYKNDIVFHKDSEVSFDGKHTRISGAQLNVEYMYEYPAIFNNPDIFVAELCDVVSYVEKNENLMIPKLRFHAELLKATRNNPITGASIFELCSWHMITIGEISRETLINSGFLPAKIS